MGCWNKTCGLSNLHINSGDPVYVFVLEKNKAEDERCHTSAFFKPLLLPFQSIYDDYGGGEDSSGVALPHIMNAIKDNLIELELGKNEYHDIEVKKDEFDIDLFFEAAHEHRLLIKDNYLDFVMFRKDIVDYILDNRVIQDYVGEGGTCGYLNHYIEYKFNDILLDIPEYIEKVKEKIDKNLLFLGSDSVIFKYNHLNKVAKFIRRIDSTYCKVLDILELIYDLIKQDKIEEATQLITEHLKANFIDNYMSSVRRVWIPGAHEGSQSNDPYGYRLLNSAINTILDTEEEE